jgi:hypothetical protein
MISVHRRKARTRDGLAHRRTFRRQAAKPSLSGITRAVALGSIAALMALGWPLHIGATLMLGIATMLWMIGNFAMERPG